MRYLKQLWLRFLLAAILWVGMVVVAALAGIL